MKAEKEFPANQEFSKSLTKPENKTRMQDFIKDGFRRLAAVSEKEIIYTVVGEYAYNLSKQQHEPELLCHHAEADTAIYTIYHELRLSNYDKPCVIDTTDTDNYVQATYVANKTPGQMFIKHKKTYIVAQKLCKQSMVDVIIPLYRKRP